MPETRFTTKQGQYLAFIHAYTKLNRRPPAVADFQSYFQVTAPSAQNMIVRLTQLGLITRTPGAPRSIQLEVPPEALPVLK
jgi:Mn-dependent DtxR family transcriptional regulator